MQHDVTYRFCPCCGANLTSRCVKPGEPDRLCCEGCEFVFYLDPKVSAGVIVTIDEQILLLRRAIEPAYGKWVFPGGFVDRGEAPADAAIREAFEEAGVRIQLRDLVGVFHHPPGHPVILIVYRGEVVDGVPQALDEALELGVFAPDDIPWDDLAFPTTRLALEAWRDHSRNF